MKSLIARLIALTGGLSAAAGAPPDALAALRRLITAIIIQADPTQAFPDIPPDTDLDIVDAATAGAALAAERDAAGVRSRVVREGYLEAIHGPERTAEVFGPFLDADNQPVVFRLVDVVTLLAVEMVVELPFMEVHEQPMMLPAGTAGDADLRVFQIPAGTVWVRGERLAIGAPGYAVLRVSGGTLELDTPATQSAPGGPLRIGPATAWRLSVTPEPAPRSIAGGSDGAATAVTLPTGLNVSSDGTVSVDGAVGIAGFGDPLPFATPNGGPVHADQHIAFPYAAPAGAWSLGGNRSPVADLAGNGAAQAGVWALPLTSVAPEEAFEAAHGGLVVARLQGELAGGLGGADGRLVWRDTSLTASALGLEVAARAGEAAARLNLSHWPPAQSRADLAGEVRSLRLASVRDGADLVSLAGGRLRTRWDLPRAADGDPLGFDGRLARVAIARELDGLWRTFLRAADEPLPSARGLALENLYLLARPPRAVTAAGSGPAAGETTEGRARLVFDVEAGEPMLPDPYAASWTLPAEPRLVEAALSIVLRWAAGAPPELRAQLERDISFPEPRDLSPDAHREIEGLFREHLAAQPESLSLLDLSSHEDHYGVALETLSDARARLDGDNRLAVALSDVRLLMQPQVHWEPVEALSPVGTVRLLSETHGGRTLVGVNSVKLAPVLPRAIGDEILAARRDRRAALFSLPFGVRAFVAITSRRQRGVVRPPVAASAHEPAFPDDLTAARQIRLEAGRRPLGAGDDPARTMPGRARQTANLLPNAAGLDNVLADMRAAFNDFPDGVPLHAADLSGYGLSAFSDWHLPGDPDTVGMTQARFDVLIGRTAYEMIQFRSILAPCQARIVRTFIMERRNSGRVTRFDSGWQALDDGLYNRYVPFDTGAVQGLRRIRNIRILPEPRLVLADLSEWQPVRFDADAEIAELKSGSGGKTPTLDQAGYVQMKPVTPPTLPGHDRFRLLFAQTGPIGGPLDCVAVIGGTLEMRLSSLAADYAPDDGGGDGFAVAVYGAPTLSRIGQWNMVRIDGVTSDVSPVDARRGAPVVRRGGQPYALREPADARRTAAKAEFGFLFSTASSRVLFPRPSIDPGQPGELTGAPPLMADPVSLVQASSAFPRAPFALRGQAAPKFRLSSPSDWRLETPDIGFDPPLPSVMDGADWKLDRLFDGGPQSLKLLLDPAAAAPWQVLQPPDNLQLDVDPFGHLLNIRSAFSALSDTAAGLGKPTVSFGPALDALQDIVNALKALIDLPFDVQVDVAAGHGPSPSFVVRLSILLRIAEGPDKRIDIGVGKFYGQFELAGELEAALNGQSHGRVGLEFRGDVQQGIIPPAIYAGGLFRFRMEVSGDAKPLIELSLGITASIGGDLIKGLLEVEVTVSYGYTLVPSTLQPGVLLGLEARAKLLAGLVGFSFSADAMARIQRLNVGEKSVRIFADIRVAANVQVAIFIKKPVDFRTQFEQDLPLAPLAILASANPLAVAAAQVVL